MTCATCEPLVLQIPQMVVYTAETTNWVEFPVTTAFSSANIASFYP